MVYRINTPIKEVMAAFNAPTMTHRFFPLGILLCAAAVLSTPTYADSACRIADAYLEAGLIEEARKVLKAEVQKPAEPDECVISSLRNVAEATRVKERAKLERQLEQAQALQLAGDYAGALKILEAASTDPAADSTVSEMVEDYKNAKKEAELDYVRILAGGGLRDEALKALKDVLEENPGVVIPKDLKHLSGGGIEVWRDTKEWLGTYAVPASEILILLFVVWLVAHYIWRWGIAKPLLVIKDFDATGVSLKNGGSVTALMEASYQDFARGHGASATRISGNLESIALPTAIQQALPGPLKNPIIEALIALFDKILPRRTYTVDGYLQDSETKGAGLTILITSDKSQLGSVSLWERDYCGKKFSFDSASPSTNVDQSGDFEALAEYAAIWLLFKLKQGFGFRSVPLRTLKLGWFRKLLGTRFWRAYALFRAGYHAEKMRTSAAARELYVSALRVDPKLSIAKINLARLAREDKSEWQYARSLWEECWEEGQNRWPYFSYPHEQSHYAAMYSLASLSYDEHDDIGAHKYAQELSDSIAKRLNELALLSLGGLLNVKTDLRNYLEFLQPVVHAMLGGLRIVNNDVCEGAKIIEKVAETSRGLPRFQYNLACSYSLWASQVVDANKKKELLDSSLKHLRNSFWLGEGIAKKAREGDRSLEYVSTQRKTEFDEIIRLPITAPIQRKRYDLERLYSIDRANAEKLSKEHLETVSDLLLSTRTLAQREALAESLDIGVEQIENWAQAMELASLRGIELEDVNLLYSANVRSLTDLKGVDPATLRLRLIDWAKTKKLKVLPDQSQVELWVNEARRASPYILI